eukprot:6099338-Amphidinium_carterae.1
MLSLCVLSSRSKLQRPCSSSGFKGCGRSSGDHTARRCNGCSCVNLSARPQEAPDLSTHHRGHLEWRLASLRLVSTYARKVGHLISASQPPGGKSQTSSATPWQSGV